MFIESYDGLGYVIKVDHYGSDESIVQVARISHEDNEQHSSTKKFIQNLLRLGHHTPFEFARLQFEINIPIFLDRQLVRHRTAARVERSLRYNVARPEFFISSVHPPQEVEIIEQSNSQAIKTYEELLNKGVKKELARTVLPLSLYTKYYWTIDLRNLLHFFKLRLHKSAQRDMQLYAKAIFALTWEVFPITMDLWLNLQEDKNGKISSLAG